MYTRNSTLVTRNTLEEKTTGKQVIPLLAQWGRRSTIVQLNEVASFEIRPLSSIRLPADQHLHEHIHKGL